MWRPRTRCLDNFLAFDLGTLTFHQVKVFGYVGWLHVKINIRPIIQPIRIDLMEKTLCPTNSLMPLVVSLVVVRGVDIRPRILWDIFCRASRSGYKARFTLHRLIMTTLAAFFVPSIIS
jgi:hypothetical protein